jgi:putative membrane protein
MKTLVLCVDRDNDLGRKANIESPIIGKKNNVEAATKLAIVDPEDSDVNAIFSAVSTYENLKEEGRKVEVATICGDIDVGVKSDQILAEQLEKVIEKTKAEDVILITDGAEDEYILPIIQSRIKISSVKRVTVKQSKLIENEYYKFVKFLEDEKIQKKFLLPIALVMIVWAVFTLLGNFAGYSISSFTIALLTLGAYILIRAMRWEKNVEAIWKEIKAGLLGGKLTFYIYIIAIALLIAIILYAYNQATSVEIISIWHFITSFLANFIWGAVAVSLLVIFGRMIDVYIREKRMQWSYWILPFSSISFGFIATSVFDALSKILSGSSINVFLSPKFVGDIIIGIFIVFIGSITYSYIKDIFMLDVEEEIEKLT